MRPVLALFLTVGLLLGVFMYVRFAERVRRPAVEFVIDYAEGEVEVEITRTFECVSDPILGMESLVVLFKGEKVYASLEDIPVDEVVQFSLVEGIETGENEILVKANRAEATDGLDAVRVKVRRNGNQIAATTLTNEPGLATIAGPIVFKIKTVPGDQPDDH